MIVYLLIMLYEWFLFVHNLNRIVIFGDLFLVEIYRKIKVNLYLLCLNYECFGVKFVKIYPEMKKLGFWLII